MSSAFNTPAADFPTFTTRKFPAGADPAVNIPGFAYFGREPYSYIQRVEQRYQFTDNFSWTIGRHNTKFGADVNYLPLTATFTVNYGGVYDFGSLQCSCLGLCKSGAGRLPDFPDLSPVQSYGAGLPGDFIQGLGGPSDTFKNIPIGVFWQDSWRISPKVTLNYGLRYDVEIPPKFKPPQGLALPAYNVGIAERNSDRQEQFPAAYRLGLGSPGQRQDRGARIVWHLL